MFDGVLGVLAGVECLRVIQENNIPLKHPVEVIAFSEEEGRFGGMFGVQALCGNVSPEWIESVKDDNGIFLKDEMKNLGFNPLDALSTYREPETIHAYLELHIEQGPVLDDMKRSIGVVEGITGVFDWFGRIIGKANHSGTTPMETRRDAFLGLCDFAHEIPRIIAENGSNLSRLTIGKVDIKPGFVHVVPGEVEFTLSGRDLDEELLWELAKACRKVLSAIARQRNLMFEFHEKA
jgi:beta-ureidopropionase / N-carbamoyl-L-amino-acid hydrolase